MLLRGPAIASVCACLAFAWPAGAVPHPVKLAADLFGETVGEVRLTVDDGPTKTTFTYLSELRVVRDRVRLKQRAFIESVVDNQTGHLVRTVSRRCSGPEKGALKCGDYRVLKDRPELPALAAEWWFATRGSDRKSCVDLIDEESGETGQACATAVRTAQAVLVHGERFGRAFDATWRDGVLRRLELPASGATFHEVSGEVEWSEADLFADPVPASGDVQSGLDRGVLRLQVSGDEQALAALSNVSTAWQRPGKRSGGELEVEVRQAVVPKSTKFRAILDHAAFLVAQARGEHLDCQNATAWFVEQARKRKWIVRPVVGVAWVDGRFAFHSWAVVEAPDGVQVPVDPLLAQVPADAGHLQLVPAETDAGDSLVRLRGKLHLRAD